MELIEIEQNVEFSRFTRHVDPVWRDKVVIGYMITTRSADGLATTYIPVGQDNQEQ